MGSNGENCHRAEQRPKNERPGSDGYHFSAFDTNKWNGQQQRDVHRAPHPNASSFCRSVLIDWKFVKHLKEFRWFRTHTRSRRLICLCGVCEGDSSRFLCANRCRTICPPSARSVLSPGTTQNENRKKRKKQTNGKVFLFARNGTIIALESNYGESVRMECKKPTIKLTFLHFAKKFDKLKSKRRSRGLWAWLWH